MWQLTNRRSFSAKKFYESFEKNHIYTNPLQKIKIAVENGIIAFNDPTQGAAVAALGDVFSKASLTRMRDVMRNDKEGRLVLRDKPTFGLSDFNMNYLKNLPLNTVGYHFYEFLKQYGDDLSEREPTHYVDDPELAYIMLRYRQLHDFAHVAYDIGISVEAEVVLKCIELVQTRLPMTLFATLLGPLTCPSVSIEKNSHTTDNSAPNIYNPRQNLVTNLIPWAISAAMKCRRPMYAVYVEKWLDHPMLEFRKNCGIITPPYHLKIFL